MVLYDDVFSCIWGPRPVIYTTPLPEILRLRNVALHCGGSGCGGGCSGGGRDGDGLSENDGGVEIAIVDLVMARAAE